MRDARARTATVAIGSAVVALCALWLGARELLDDAAGRRLQEWAHPAAMIRSDISTNDLRIIISEVDLPAVKVVELFRHSHHLSGGKLGLFSTERSRVRFLGVRQVKGRISLAERPLSELFFHTSDSLVTAVHIGPGTQPEKTEIILLQLRTRGEANAARAMRDRLPMSVERASGVFPGLQYAAHESSLSFEEARAKFLASFRFDARQADAPGVYLVGDAALAVGHNSILIAAFNKSEIETIHLSRSANGSPYALARLTSP